MAGAWGACGSYVRTVGRLGGAPIPGALMRSYEIPPVVAELRARLLAKQHGCTLTPFGCGWLVQGPHADLLISDLRELRAGDLAPPKAADFAGDLAP